MTYKLATRAIHAGQEPDARTGAVNVPVYLSTTFKQDAIGKDRGFEYARTNNPSRASLEETIAALEGGRFGASFASGLAATAAVGNLLEPGDEIVSTVDVYGGTYRLFARIFGRYGVTLRSLQTSDATEIARAAGPRTRMLWIETPTNPMLNVIDLQRVAEMRPRGCLLVVDNTFASPYFQNPLEFGADIVVHSVTKYLGGHSDVVGGALVTNDPTLNEKLRFYQNAAGGVPAPFDCFLVQRGIKTLAVRMERHAANAIRVAETLAGHPKVARVFFPWLKEHPHHDVARRQMRGPSGMVSVRLRGGRPAVDAFLAKLRLFTLAESLGGVESLVCYPATMTHGSIPQAEREASGITDDLVRLSVGIEDADDLCGEIAAALA